MDGGANIFSSAILGTGFQMVVIKVKTYTIEAPTIRTIAGVAGCLSKLDLSEDAKSIKDLLLSNKDAAQYAKALSWMIEGDEELTGELSNGTYKDVISALCDGFELLSPSVFYNAASLMRTVSHLTASHK